MQVNFTKPEASRLYELLGVCLWLQQIGSSTSATDGMLLDAVKTFLKENQDLSYPGVTAMECMNNLQNSVYYALTHDDEHVQEQTAALRMAEQRAAIKSIHRQVNDLQRAES